MKDAKKPVMGRSESLPGRGSSTAKVLVLGTVRKPAGWSRGRSLEIWLERLVEVGSRRASGGLFKESGLHSRWEEIPLGVCCGLYVETRLEAGVRSRREMMEAWTAVMAAEGKEGWI